MPEPDNLPVGDPDNSGQISVVNSDGSFAENWYEKYGAENKPTLSRFKKFDDLVNSHMSQRKKFGKDPNSLVELPTDKSSDEVKAAFSKARGVPDTTDGYKFEKSLEISEKVDVNDAQISNFKDIAKKWDLDDRQFNGVVNDYLKSTGDDIIAFENQMVENDAQAIATGNKILNQMFKEEAPGRKTRANGILDKYGLNKVKMADGSEVSIKAKLFEENPKLMTSPWMIMFLDRVAGAMSEDTLKGIGTTTFDSADQVKSKLAELRAHPGYLDRNHAQHKDLMRQKTELYKKMPA